MNGPESWQSLRNSLCDQWSWLGQAPQVCCNVSPRAAMQGDSNRGASRLAANKSLKRASDSRDLLLPHARSHSFDECAQHVRKLARQWYDEAPEEHHI